MSRSYREPWFVDSYGSRVKKLTKREANKRVRKYLLRKELDDGCAYRRIFDPWNIVDWRSRWNPWPHQFINCVTGEIEFILPTPEWKARRK